MAVPSAVRHRSTGVSSKPLCGQMNTSIWFNMKLLSALLYNLPSTNIPMPQNWAPSHHGGTDCPIAGCLISIRADSGPDVYTKPAARFILSALFRMKLVLRWQDRGQPGQFFLLRSVSSCSMRLHFLVLRKFSANSEQAFSNYSWYHRYCRVQEAGQCPCLDAAQESSLPLRMVGKISLLCFAFLSWVCFELV